MKRATFSVIFLLVTVIVSAQLRVALTGGAHQSKVIEDNPLPSYQEIKSNYKGRTGLHLGFLADIPFSITSKVSFQPAILYYNKGRKYLSNADSTVLFPQPGFPDSVVTTFYSDSRKQYVDYIDIPLNFVYKFPLGKSAKFIIGAGPYISFYFKAKESAERALAGINYVKEENDDPLVGKGAGQYRTTGYGLNGLAGFEIGRIFFTANYSKGLNDFYQSTEHDGGFKHELFGASVGIFLGKAVKMELKDRDKDGVPDKDDRCPTVAGSPAMQGCADLDGDGIRDDLDSCAHEFGPSANKGCPYFDTDKDGVLDNLDNCKNIAGPADNHGCPYPDKDKDRILDKDDKCPDVAGMAKYQGCPIPDTDKDGINDELDKCPSVAGIAANNGCPPIAEAVRKKVALAAKEIQFKANSAELTADSYKVLDRVAVTLNENPTLSMSIEGHSSSEGARGYNLKLSQSRADSVKDYLIKKSVNPDKLKSVGYGPDQPLNEGKTARERALNRRVELKLSNQ